MLSKQFLLACALGAAHLAQASYYYPTNNGTTSTTPYPTGTGYPSTGTGYPTGGCHDGGCGGECGDKIVQSPYEECDLGPELNGKEGSGCSADCKFVAFCGNGNVDDGEECDEGWKNNDQHNNKNTTECKSTHTCDGYCSRAGG